MKEEQTVEYLIDWKQTLYANIIWLIFLFFICFFTKTGLDNFANLINQELSLMGTIFTLFFCLKMCQWIGRPELRWRIKE